MNAILRVGRRIIGLQRLELARLRGELKALRLQRDGYAEKLSGLVRVQRLNDPMQNAIHLQVSVDRYTLESLGEEFIAEEVAKRLVNGAARAGNGSTAGCTGGDRRPAGRREVR